MTAPIRDRSIAALDVPLPAVEAEAERLWAERDRRIAKARLAARLDRLPWLIAHPEWSTGRASDGVQAEYRHLLYDADSDASTEPFPYPTPKEATA